ncbi:MAG: FAD-dependent oxidoreductase, partial [Chitinophagaceae bacterium]|nr:FAD-dependent oxidoreductase [Chitinophagaceae bacterium]
MSNSGPYYDVAIIGGGLAGLATAIFFARDGFSVILFEKENYPFHKVCGEYISFESWDFLKSLGVPLEQWNLPEMDTLHLSAPNGNSLTEKLPLGGFGVSRFMIDYAMVQIARQHGALVRDGIKVQEVEFRENAFTITTDDAVVRANICCGAFGKRSNLDVRWKRRFVQQK